MRAAVLPGRGVGGAPMRRMDGAARFAVVAAAPRCIARWSRVGRRLRVRGLRPSAALRGRRIAGVDVGGLSTTEATRRLLASASGAAGGVPVDFVVGSKRVADHAARSSASQVDWAAAVDAARAARATASGPCAAPAARRAVLRRGASPRRRVYDAALNYELDQIAAPVDRPHREAGLVLHGLHAGDRPGAAPGTSSTAKRPPRRDRRGRCPGSSAGAGVAARAATTRRR